MKTNEEVKAFFKNKGLWERITESIVEYPYDVNSLKNELFGQDFLLHSFCWNKTTEGEQFWSDMNDQYQRWYKTDTDKDLTPIEALNRLILLRDVYREGWKPKYGSNMEIYSIIIYANDYTICATYGTSDSLFSFEKLKQAEEFLEKYEDLFEKIKKIY